MTRWADSVYLSLSTEERIAQLIMPIIYPSASEGRIIHEERRVRSYGWGGILYQRGLLHEQHQMNTRLQGASRLPMLIALDGEWGLYMRLKDAPRYPRNMGLGLNDDPQLIYNYGREVARQCRLMGIHVNFAPTVDVNSNPKNPVIGTRSFGSDPKAVSTASLAYAAGLEDGGVLSVAKHFPGHGDTSEDSHKTLPILNASRARIKALELIPFQRYIDAGHGGVMTAHLRVPAYEKEQIPSSLSYAITTDLLRGEMGFGGLVFTDGLEMQGALQHSSRSSTALLALLAGNDMLLGPASPERAHAELLAAHQAGILTEDILRDRVLRILYYKWRLIVTQAQPSHDIQQIRTEIYHKSEERLRASLWRASLHFVRKDKRTLDGLEQGKYRNIAVVEVGKNPVSLPNRPQRTKSGGSITYLQETAVAKSPAQLGKYDLILYNVYQPNAMPLHRLGTQAHAHPVLVCYYSTPYKVNTKAMGLDKASNVVIAMEAAPEAQMAMLSILAGQSLQMSSDASDAGEHDPTAGMSPQPATATTPSQSIAEPTTAVGSASRTSTSASTTSSPAPNSDRGMESMDWAKLGRKDLQPNPTTLRQIDELVQEGIRSGAFPGAQVVVLRHGVTLVNKAYGTMMGIRSGQTVTPQTIYDVASITKALATTPAVMLMVGDGKLKLEDRVEKHLTAFAGSAVGGIRIRDLLLHQSGLPAGLDFYRDLIDASSYSSPLIQGRASAGYVQIASGSYGNPSFSFLPQYVSRVATEQHKLQLAQGLWLSPSFRERMQERLLSVGLKGVGRYRYSDLSFLLLQWVVEHVSGQSLDALLSERIFRPVGAEVYYNPLQAGIAPERIAPAQEDKFLRQQTIRGTVDDETAACLGGVGGNAGLFASATELAKLAQLLLDGGLYKGKQIIPQRVVEQFLSTTGVGGRRALGFDKPTQSASNPAGESASRDAVGHYGFTGTAFWIDPRDGLVFVFLSNRTYPSRANNALSRERYRPRLHELSYAL